MLFHHSQRDYHEAASEAARAAKGKLMQDIDRGKEFATSLAERVFTEIPVDHVVAGKALKFDGDADSREKGAPDGLLVNYGDVINSLTRHSTSQLCQRAKMPQKYLSWLGESERRNWGLPLAAENLQEIYSHSSDRFLLRSYDNRLRGFLSDRYRRRDSRPLLEGFMDACQQVGALPYDAIGSETRVSMKAVLPMVFEPVDNEVMSIGCMWENSDYGAGKHSLWVFISRLWCTNKAIMTTGFAQIHLGRKLADNPLLSQKTIDLDTQTTISAMHDVVNETMSPDTVDALCSVIKKASEDNIDVGAALERYKKKFTKEESDAVREKFNTPDVVQLPPGNTVWRLSNAVSWLSNETEEPDRKLELMKIAGEMLPKAPRKE
jgi:hypothetical protein